MKFLILSLLLVGCSSPVKYKDHIRTDFDWTFRKVRNSSGAVILKEDGRPLKNACLSREEFKEWVEFKVKQCKGK